MTLDVLVIGGGPAGSATAIAAREAGLTVQLLESAEPPLRKVCGEFLSDPGMDAFRRLAGSDSLRFPKIRTAAFRAAAPAGRTARILPSLRLEPAAWGVRRATLDGALLKAASERGVRVRTGTRAVACVRDGAVWRVTARTGEAGRLLETIEAVHVVRATGRRACPGADRGAWLGRKAYTATGPRLADVEICFVPGGYYGLSAVEDGSFSLCALSRAPRPAWESDAGRRHEGVVLSVSTPRFRLGRQPPVDPWSFHVGDALAAWPPLVGDGITMALLSGLELGSRLGSVDFDPAAWGRVWGGRFGRALGWSLALHAAVQSEWIRNRVLGAGERSQKLGEWLLAQPRYVPRR